MQCVSSVCWCSNREQLVCVQHARRLDPGARELHTLLHKQRSLALHLCCVQSLHVCISIVSRMPRLSEDTTGAVQQRLMSILEVQIGQERSSLGMCNRSAMRHTPCNILVHEALLTQSPSKPPSSRFAATTLWHGTSGAKGFRLKACKQEQPQGLSAHQTTGFLRYHKTAGGSKNAESLWGSRSLCTGRCSTCRAYQGSVRHMLVPAAAVWLHHGKVIYHLPHCAWRAL